jgi:hypothetical protein
MDQKIHATRSLTTTRKGKYKKKKDTTIKENTTYEGTHIHPPRLHRDQTELL